MTAMPRYHQQRLRCLHRLIDVRATDTLPIVLRAAEEEPYSLFWQKWSDRRNAAAGMQTRNRDLDQDQ